MERARNKIFNVVADVAGAVFALLATILWLLLLVVSSDYNWE